MRFLLLAPQADLPHQHHRVAQEARRHPDPAFPRVPQRHRDAGIPRVLRIDPPLLEHRVRHSTLAARQAFLSPRVPPDLVQSGGALRDRDPHLPSLAEVDRSRQAQSPLVRKEGEAVGLAEPIHSEPFPAGRGVAEPELPGVVPRGLVRPLQGIDRGLGPGHEREEEDGSPDPPHPQPSPTPGRGRNDSRVRSPGRTPSSFAPPGT